MELKMRIVEYTQVIIDDTNMLLREESSLSERQRKLFSTIPMHAEEIIALYEQCLSELAVENDVHLCIRSVAGVFHDARGMVAGIQARCFLIDNYHKTPLWSEKDTEIFLHIKQYNTLITDEIEKSQNDWHKGIRGLLPIRDGNS